METLFALSDARLRWPKTIYYMVARYHLHIDEDPKALLRYCITFNYIDLIPFLRAKKLIDYKYAIDHSAQNNSFTLVKWFHDRERVDDEMATTAAMDYAARSGNIEMLDWLYENRSEGCSKNACNLAVLCNKLNSLIWLDKRGLFVMDDKQISICAMHNYIDIARWLLSRGASVTKLDIETAKRINNKEFLSLFDDE